MKKSVFVLFFSLTSIVCSSSVLAATDVGFEILPAINSQSQVIKDVKDVWEVHVDTKDAFDSVNDKIKFLSAEKDGKSRPLADKLAAGMINWDVLLDYVVYIIRFMSQIGLLIGAVMIIYAGYIYASSVFTGKDGTMKPVINAIIGVVVITFSYAIMKILTNMFIE